MTALKLCLRVKGKVVAESIAYFEHHSSSKYFRYFRLGLLFKTSRLVSLRWEYLARIYAATEFN